MENRDYQFLLTMDPPFITVTCERTLESFVEWAAVHKPQTFIMPTLNGMRMGTAKALFRQTASELKFPKYFGWNWAAFKDCLWDLGWIDPAGVWLLITNGECVLNRVSDEVLSWFLDILETIGREWGTLGDRPGMPPRPFHSVLFVEPEGRSRIVRCARSQIRQLPGIKGDR